MSGIQQVTRAAAVALERRDVDTDQIIPAAWLKRVERTGFGPGLFEAWREDPDFVLNQPGADQAKVLVAGANFGCGSSREHAVWALQDFGFQAVVSPGFADIFRGNCVSSGLVPAEVDEEIISRAVRRPGGRPGRRGGRRRGRADRRRSRRPTAASRSSWPTSPSGGCSRGWTTSG